MAAVAMLLVSVIAAHRFHSIAACLNTTTVKALAVACSCLQLRPVFPSRLLRARSELVRFILTRDNGSDSVSRKRRARCVMAIISEGEECFSLPIFFVLSLWLYTLRPPVSYALSAKRRLHFRCIVSAATCDSDLSPRSGPTKWGLCPVSTRSRDRGIGMRDHRTWGI
jgi:hypothetical protein